MSRVVSNLERFRAHYGSNPIVYAQIWEDLLTTVIPDAQIDNVNADLIWLAFIFLSVMQAKR